MSDFSLRERFGHLLDGAGQMFWELDRNFRVVYANDFFKRAFGDPVGEVCHEFMACSDRICFECPVKEVFEGEERAVSVRMRRDTSGDARWLQHTATPIKNNVGEIMGASELTVDITSRKRIEEHLRDSEQRYRNLVEQVPDVIFVLDPEGCFAFVNTQVEEFLGYPVQQILETPFTDYVIPEDQPRVAGILELGPDMVWDEEIGILDAEGNRKFVRIRCKASFNAEGHPSGFEGVMRDRTARRKLEEELTTSREALVEKIKIIDELYEHIVQSGKCKAIEEHTAEVAHELRQPLAIVGGFARRMAKQMESSEELELHTQKQYVKIIVTEIERLERILERLIDFTKRGSVRLQKINPNELIRYILEITEARSKEKEVRVDARLGSEIGEDTIGSGSFPTVGSQPSVKRDRRLAKGWGGRGGDRRLNPQ